ncbi:SDR family oxidoreductase [Dyadobacter sp. Leaf189]|uniref:SDR family oxidoreductase n=1 Tax=Dyadobacter sp. Leaf189 TaxID=1736295 RepID=UPI0006FCE9A3|nr:SDR family oxidoreductase [Dyadobacter sp. Leaf189]KQS27873.1 epimerase [Dyadobacter sp. Leaf189]
MKILLTGATGYIGQRLLPVLLEQGHEIVCAVRDASRFDKGRFENGESLHVIEVDLLREATLDAIPRDIDAAYYLVHSMSTAGAFSSSEEQSARNFIKALDKTTARQCIFLGGIINDSKLSVHLSSRKNVEEILGAGRVPLTSLRAGIIVGSGSASFEIIRDLVEKLPVMIAPKWLHTRCQPISIRNVIELLSGVLMKEFTFNRHFDIYGPDILTYKGMLLGFANARGLRRSIYTVPVMTPKLSSYWLYLVTSTSYVLAKNLVASMSVDVVARENELCEKLGVTPVSYQQAIRIAFDKIEQNLVLSSWKDAWGGTYSKKMVDKQLSPPKYGVFQDKKTRTATDVSRSTDRIFAIGGKSGWYYADWLWRFRGFLDKLFGGVGLSRGRKNRNQVVIGDTLDFWRVIYANREERRLLLYAEMKLPGEAWLEFCIEGDQIRQTATFRPLGLGGRLYWYAVLPFHYFIFNGMIDRIAE